MLSAKELRDFLADLPDSTPVVAAHLVKTVDIQQIYLDHATWDTKAREWYHNPNAGPVVCLRVWP